MKKILALVLAAMVLLSLGTVVAEKSPNLYFDKELSIKGMGIHFNNYPTAFDGTFYFPTILERTNARVEIDWRVIENYGTQVATLLASGQLPDILVAGDYGVTNLASEGAIIALDDYLDLIPNIVAAVGEKRMANWRSADGHIYTIPTIVDVPGSQSVMIRQDWLDALGMKAPETWEEWLALWRGIRDNDLNGNGDLNDEIPLALEKGANGERCLASLLNAFGIACSADTQFCVLEDGTYTLVYEHPRYPEFLQAVQDLYKEGLLDQEFATRTQAELHDLGRARKALHLDQP
jgi:putative aldouronate transport system substrate-binding protein